MSPIDPDNGSPGGRGRELGAGGRRTGLVAADGRRPCGGSAAAARASARRRPRRWSATGSGGTASCCPAALRAWLLVSDGFYPGAGPAVHPLAAIGPMVPFARVPGLLVQPESWFELGNPNEAETICIDLGLPLAPRRRRADLRLGRRPDRPAAADHRAELRRLVRPAPPRGGPGLLARPRLRRAGRPLGRAPPPRPRRRRSRPGSPGCSRHVDRPVHSDLDDPSLAASLGISRVDAEALLRHLQHAEAVRVPDAVAGSR